MGDYRRLRLFVVMEVVRVCAVGCRETLVDEFDLVAVGTLAQTGGQAVHQRWDVIEEEGIDLCAHHEDETETVEEKQDNDNETQLTHIISHEFVNVERKDEKKEL